MLTTLKLRMPKGVKGAPFYVSGVIVAEDAHTLTLEVTEHNDWAGTSHTRTVAIDKWRILSRQGR